MRSALFVLIFASLVAWGAYEAWPKWPVRTPLGVLAPEDPVQTLIPERALGEIAGYQLNAVAEYALTARVLGTRRYAHDRGSKLVPVDVAAGWGPMSDRTVLEQLKISQAFRFFFFEWRGTPPIPKQEIIAHASNMHIIPANRQVAAAVSRLHPGEVVTMQGELVNACSHGETWNTSLSREDTGAGACELFYVESLVLVPRTVATTVAKK
jgi:hypothetical protein